MIDEVVVSIELEGDWSEREPELDALWDRLDALALGEVGGSMELGGRALVLFFDVAPELAARTEAAVLPALRDALEAAGLSAFARVSIAEEIDDDDD